MSSSAEDSKHCPLVADESLLPAFRALVECYHQVERVSKRHIEALGLTGSQFDVVTTLGDTPGMSCKELGERTLITKGTLTPVLDRLEARGLVRRAKGERDCRQTHVSLTPAGEAVFKETFMPHIHFMRERLDRMPSARQEQLIVLLNELRATFV